MLKALQVRNYVLIDSLDIGFPAGLIIITGQTGAGKSILLGALSLALGAKADASMVGESGENCVVEAVFETGEDEALRNILAGNGLDWNDGNLVIRRVLSRSGRSRSFVNDEPVYVSVLGDIASRLLDIHSQHETLMLADKRFQLSILDHFAGSTALLARFRDAWRSLSAKKQQLAELSERLQRLVLEKDYNEAQFGRLDMAALKIGELEGLEAEQKQLAHAEEIKSTLFGIGEMLLPSGDDGRMSLDALLKEAGRQIGKLEKYVPEAAGLAVRIESSRLEMEDVLDEIARIESRTEVSHDRLQAVEDRMSLLYDLMKKYGCTSVEELIALRDRLSDSISDSTALEEEKMALEKSIAEESALAEELASELHDVRAAAAGRFAREIEDSIRSLELERAVFDVQISETPLSADGKDSVLFLFSSTGKAPVDVAKCASGGEMSRIMLCLKAMLARYTNMPAMVFDEIDTGVSGSAADKMGSMICSMGEHMQVFAITHLPQVAAKGEAHYLVSKNADKVSGKVRTEINQISGDDRTMEIARMLSGSEITPEAIANARSMMSRH